MENERTMTPPTPMISSSWDIQQSLLAGFTGRRQQTGHSSPPHASAKCTVCGREKTSESLISIRDGVRYHVQIERCAGNRWAKGCPAIKTEQREADMRKEITRIKRPAEWVENIRKAMRDHNLGYHTFSKFCGISKSCLTDVLNKSIATPETCKSIDNALTELGKMASPLPADIPEKMQALGPVGGDEKSSPPDDLPFIIPADRLAQFARAAEEIQDAMSNPALPQAPSIQDVADLTANIYESGLELLRYPGSAPLLKIVIDTWGIK